MSMLYKETAGDSTTTRNDQISEINNINNPLEDGDVKIRNDNLDSEIKTEEDSKRPCVDASVLNSEEVRKARGDTGLRPSYRTPGWLRDVECPYQYACTFEGPHGVVNYDITGPVGAPVVLTFHGLNGTRQTFSDLSSVLCNFEFRIITFDLYGHGLSAAPGFHSYSSRYSTPFFTQQAMALLEHLGLSDSVDKIDVVGFSMGCVIAAGFADRYPELVSRLILCSPAGVLENKPLALRMLNACQCVVPCIPCCLCRCCFRKKSFLKKFNDEELKNGTAEMLWQRLVWQLFVKGGAVQSFCGCVLRLPLWKAEPLFRRVGSTGIPVLVLWGKQDQVVPASLSPKLMKCFPNGHLIMMANSSHLVLADQPRGCLASMLTFLEFPKNCSMEEFHYLLPLSTSGLYIPRAHRCPNNELMSHYLERINYKPKHWVRLPQANLTKNKSARSDSGSYESHQSQESIQSTDDRTVENVNLENKSISDHPDQQTVGERIHLPPESAIRDISNQRRTARVHQQVQEVDHNQKLTEIRKINYQINNNQIINQQFIYNRDLQTRSSKQETPFRNERSFGSILLSEIPSRLISDAEDDHSNLDE